ncbi:CGNR zinc finger domain-containing protein [Streptomyces sp. NPDC086023]|uniref:CGNR zinc finger domain-containing protein n=1 Tax=Streptomyces sp. NPDC086023 TaxID=3365746 RepID=UPI0037D93376
MTAGAGSYGLWFDSGRVCLDLVATAGPDERLGEAFRLRQWLIGTGLVPLGTPLDRVGYDWLPQFWALRDDLADLLAAALRGLPAGEALERVNARALAAPPGLCAVREPDGGLARRLHGADCTALLAAVARDAVVLLTDPGAVALLRACDGEGCTRVYLDTSRGHRRRWCSSETCGNRERVARHRRRSLALREDCPQPEGVP